MAEKTKREELEAMRRMFNSAKQLEAHQGPYYELWKRRMHEALEREDRRGKGHARKD